MPDRRPLTIPQILARRRNSRFSTGPRTEEGRRRVSLNRRRLELPQRALRNLERLRADPRSFQRVWRDVLATFAFMGPEMEPRLNALAWDFWLKQHCALRGYPVDDLHGIEARLEKNLRSLLHVYSMTNRKWMYYLRRDFGPLVQEARQFRMAVELRLGSTQELAREGKLPQESETALLDAVLELSDVLIDFEARLTGNLA